MKKPASPFCAFGLFGLSGVCGCIRLANWTRQTGLVTDGQAIDGLLCRHGFSAACEPARRQALSQRRIGGCNSRLREECGRGPECSL
jgi:hypothetical protein